MEAHKQHLESVAHQPGSPPEPVPETSGLRIVFRGYDMAQVDDLVASLIDGRDSFYMPDPGDAATRAGIERITSKTKAILLAAQQSAQELRGEASNEAAELRAGAESYSQTLRAEAEAYAAEVRGAADAAATKQTDEAAQGAVATIEEADRESAQIIREAHAERLRIEAMIEELREHRDVIVENLERLRGNLSEVVEESHQRTYEWGAEDGDEGEGGLDLNLDDFEEDTASNPHAPTFEPL